ncbi:hypothetical protein [Massiliimalia timonensis]|uniref:hypothetical protein n=1 Tax=Massiliimalia timonensis TaxID=1987501 RepID=UPI00189CFE22|nr:hypothetical protein [Massiliimalia timonensis]
MFLLTPSQNLEARSEQVCMAESERMTVVYIPYHDKITILRGLSEYMVKLFALGSKKVILPLMSVYDGKTKLHLSDLNEDMLLIVSK